MTRLVAVALPSALRPVHVRSLRHFPGRVATRLGRASERPRLARSSELCLEPSSASVHDTRPTLSDFPSCRGTIRVPFPPMPGTELDTAIGPGLPGAGRPTGIAARTRAGTTTKMTMTGIVVVK